MIRDCEKWRNKIKTKTEFDDSIPLINRRKRNAGEIIEAPASDLINHAPFCRVHLY